MYEAGKCVFQGSDIEFSIFVNLFSYNLNLQEEVEREPPLVPIRPGSCRKENGPQGLNLNRPFPQGVWALGISFPWGNEIAHFAASRFPARCQRPASATLATPRPLGQGPRCRPPRGR